jgi:hypothetical protein
MSLIEHIKVHVPEEQQPALLKRLGEWMAIDDPTSITPELEKQPRFKIAIEGAANIMRNRGFDWTDQGESVQAIGQRWRHVFDAKRHTAAFGMRFSTTVPLVATFGFLERTERGSVTLRWVRYHFREDGLFQPEHSTQKMDFIGALLYGMSYMKGHDCPLNCLRCLDLNHYGEVQQALDGYVRHNPDVDDWEGSDEEENERVGYTSYSSS